MALAEIAYPQLNTLLTPGVIERLDALGDLLFSEAMPAGFIGDCTRAELDLRHIFDSILPAIAPESHATFPLWQTESLQVYDLGAGAGLPSLPLALLFPQHTFHLLDAQEKRCRFAIAVSQKIGLTNVNVYHGVVQDFSKTYRQKPKADVVVFRAFRKILASLELALHVLESPQRIQSGAGVRPRSSQKQAPAKVPETGLLTPSPHPVQASAVAVQSPKVLYWRSQSVPFSDAGFKRVADLGYTIDSFVKFSSADTILPRGLYTFARVADPAAGFPRSWKKISADKLVETES